MTRSGAATLARLSADEVRALEALLWLVESVAGARGAEAGRLSAKTSSR